MGQLHRKLGVKRKYRSPHRRALAEQTRRQIAASARILFREQGYARTRIEEIARAAKVAAPTVYAAFGGKRAILLSLLDDMEQSAEASRLFTDLDQLSAHPARQLQEFLRFSMQLFKAGDDLIRIGLQTGQGDPDIAALWTEGGKRRRETCRRIVAGWLEADALRPGLPNDEATDVLWAFSGPEIYSQFAHGLGWETDRLASWLQAMLAPRLLSRSG